MASRRVKMTTRTTTECGCEHTQTHTRSAPPSPSTPLTGHPPTPDPSTALESNERGAANLCPPCTDTPNTHRITRDSLYTHRALLPFHFIFTMTWTVTPPLPIPLFYRDLFIHFPSLAEENSVNTYPAPCERGCACVCVCVVQYGRMVCVCVCVCNLCVCLYRYERWTHWTGGPIIPFLLFLRWRGGCVTAKFHLQSKTKDT